MKNVSLLFVAALYAAPVCVAAVSRETVNGEYVITVNAGDADETLTSADIAALGTTVNLVKRGEGRLIIESDLAGWVGEARIEAGYLQVRHQGALGYTGKDAASGGLVVKDGGTLEIDGTVIKGSTDAVLSCKKYTLEGTGVGGTAGAVYLFGNNSYWYGSGTVVFTGDTTFKADKNDRQLDMRNGLFNFNGHTIMR